jgi:hypothetical protein
MSTLSTESADLLDAAQLAALQADWPAVQHAAAAALQAMPSVSSHLEVAVKLLLLRSQAQHHLHQFHEALKVSDPCCQPVSQALMLTHLDGELGKHLKCS